MVNLATNFDDGKFLLRGLALYNSISRNCDDFCLWVLCMDEKTFHSLSKLNLEKMKLINVSEIETEELLRVKAERTLREYCMTSKAPFVLHLLQKNPEMGSITWLDADLMFFDSLEKIHEEMGNYSVLLSPNNFPKRIADNLIKETGMGIFNAGMFVFKNDQNGIECLKWWTNKCIEWCFNDYEDGKLGEQLYLDEMSSKFSGVKTLSNQGINVAYWNIERYEFYKKEGKVKIFDIETRKEFPLVFYHFSGLTLYKIFGRVKYLWNRRFINIKAKKYVYDEYLKDLNWAFKKIKKDLDPDFEQGLRVGANIEYFIRKMRKYLISLMLSYPRLTLIARKIMRKNHA